MEKPMKWFYELTSAERRTYPLDRIKVGFDRLDGEWITADQVYLVRLPNRDLRKQDNKLSR